MTTSNQFDEGSSACCTVLRVMHRHPEGLSLESITGLTGLDPYTVREALAAVKARGRAVDCMRGNLRMWQTIHHATAAHH